MKKILFLVQLPPPLHGASSVNDLIKKSRTVSSRFTTRFINISPGDDLSNLGRVNLLKLLAMVRIFIITVSMYIRFRPDLVYLTLSPRGLAFYKDGLLALVVRMLGGKVVYHMHGKGIRAITSRSLFKRFLYRFVFKNAAVVHLSEHLLYDVEDVTGKSNNVFVLNNGVESAKPELVAKKHTAFTFVYLSNFARTKGADVLIRAAQIVSKESDQEFRVKLIGSPRDPLFVAELEQLVTGSSTGNVELCGPLYGDEKISQLSRCHVFVLPTRSECFPLSVLEAMSVGLAVISTTEGAIPEIVDNGVTGDVLSDITPESLANVMIRHLEDRDYSKRCGEAGLRKFNNRYTQDVFQENLVRILETLTRSTKKAEICQSPSDKGIL